MNILIEAHHPAHVHFFKNAVRLLRLRGDAVHLLGRDRDVMRDLLDAYDWIPHTLISTAGRTNRLPFGEMLRRQWSVLREILSRRADLVISLMGTYTQGARLAGVPNLVFTDSEFQRAAHAIAHPFATEIFTPECFTKPLGVKQRRYRGYHELAFLHPRYFRADRSVLDRLGEPAKTGYAIIRLSSWNTFHDVGQRGIAGHLDRIVADLSRFVHPLIAPEHGIELGELERYRLRVPPHLFHHVIAFARLVITEGASTASEAACVGVPAVFINSTSRGYLDDQQKRYGLVQCFRDPVPAISRALDLLENPPAPSWLERQRLRLIDDHVDVTEFLLEQIERYRPPT